MTEDHGSLSRKATSLSGLAMICARSREATIAPLDSCRLASLIICSKPLARGEQPGEQEPRQDEDLAHGSRGDRRLTWPPGRGISPALQRRAKRRIRFSGSPFGSVFT
jgi:hypothetical protein